VIRILASTVLCHAVFTPFEHKLIEARCHPLALRAPVRQQTGWVCSSGSPNDALSTRSLIAIQLTHYEGRPFQRTLYTSARTDGVGVGIVIAHNPLHRSGRAACPHPALASGDNAATA
jgi:hypothetical protein